MNNLAERLAHYHAHLDAQLAICDAATAGPWFLQADEPYTVRTHPNGGDLVADTWTNHKENATFIADARTGYPDVLRNLKRAMQALEEAMQTFANYGYMHATKFPPQAEKSLRNYEKAKAIEDTILSILDAHDLSTASRTGNQTI